MSVVLISLFYIINTNLSNFDNHSKTLKKFNHSTALKKIKILGYSSFPKVYRKRLILHPIDWT